VRKTSPSYTCQQAEASKCGKCQKELLGPGSYSLQKEFLKDTKRVTIAPFSKQEVIEYSPGPGYYEHTKADPIVRKSSPSKKITPLAASTSTASFNTNPGPGFYNLSPSKPKAFTIGKK
jgi:hypothetical protein